MITLENVKKIYNSKRRRPCAALKGVSFTLPDTGMVFVLGKSGSGKSTLLNLLGGLDSVTEGKIIVDGNDFSTLNAAENDAYRSAYVGFVFQDFCLIDGLTVAENVRLSLDLLGKEDEGEVLRCLDEVDLAEKADRYPRELSGGQCQRVAIARALVKSPRLILADEPTGNLDSKTAKHVLDVLKELSAKHLVVLVTHNAEDAAQYGDRIIELSDGEIVRDIERSREASVPLIGEDVITLPREGVLSDAELDAINARIEQGNVRVTQAKEAFAKTEQPCATSQRVSIGRPPKMKPKAALKLSATLTKGGYVGTAVTSLILAVLTLLLCFSLAFSFFDSEPLLRDAIHSTDDKSFVMNKGYYSSDPLDTSLQDDLTMPVQEAEVNAFYEAGYEGNTYLLYTTPFCFEKTYGYATIEKGEQKETVLDYRSPYAKYGNGVLATDEAFLNKLYGGENGITLLAGEMSEEANNKGVLISDYAADCILHYNSKIGVAAENPYQAVVDKKNLPRVNVSGVFYTGYKERYAEIFAQYEAISQMADKDARSEASKQLLTSDLFADFATEVDKYLSIGYYIGADYATKVESGVKFAGAVRFHNTDIYSNGKLLLEDVSWMYSVSSPKVEKGTVLLGRDAFNKAFGTKYNDETEKDFVPVDITLIGYANNAEDGDEPIYNYTFTIVGFTSNKDGGLRFSEEDYQMLRHHDHYAYAVYFDNADGAAALYDTGSAIGYFTNNMYFKSVYTVKQIVEIFGEVFVYVGASIALLAFLFIGAFSMRTLRRRRREIGILRALGGRVSQIALAFVLQVLLLGGIATVLSAIALPLITGSVNTLLAENLATFLEVPAIANLDVINLSPFVLPIVLGIFIPVLILSSVVPFLFVRKLKPMSIIRSSDK